MTNHEHVRFSAAPAGAARRRRPGRRGAIALTTIFSLAGLAMGIAAVVMLLLGGAGVPGKGLDWYETDTPEGAARFRMAAQANADMLADMEYEQAKLRLKAEKNKAREAVDSFECDGTMEYDGKVVVLFKYKDKDRTRYRAEWLEKKDDGRYWDAKTPSLRKDDAREIREKISKWRSQESDSVGTVRRMPLPAPPAPPRAPTRRDMPAPRTSPRRPD